METQRNLLDRQTELCKVVVHNRPPIEEQSLNSMEVIKTLAAHQNVDGIAIRAIVDGIKGYKALFSCSEDISKAPVVSCLLAADPDPDLSLSLEQDFTTNGPRGNLHCPFSKPHPSPFRDLMENDKEDGPKVPVDTCGHDDLDPIRIDLEERRSCNTPSGPSAGSTGSCAALRCPIRYLDKHSPEEVADYVERHKHEIPRSHAICIQRYQRDPQNMREMDNKYGNLINMISSLSAKHQVFLPNRQDGDAPTVKSNSTQLVEKWSEAVEHVHHELVDPDLAVADPNTAVEDDNRESHFDRPLRDVRLGESPSRPWGVPVPFNEQPNDSASSSPPASVAPDADVILPLNITASKIPAKSGARCPFGHDAPNAESAKPAMTPEKADMFVADAAVPEVFANSAGRCPLGHDAPASEPTQLATAPANADSPAIEETGGTGAIGAEYAGDNTTIEDPAVSSDIPLPGHVTYNGPVTFTGSVQYTAAVTINGPVMYSGPVHYNRPVKYSGPVQYSREPAN